ncbi:outer membrane lipid asymmetry maintenance protein MlaD [Allohahella sp. A8]|uniref:outer membrane lipid asymmetry maintenance protein MlaD n=1 Tax=Allohahella sp. A8 TaxID=3141461 RepID=UPI003A7F795B
MQMRTVEIGVGLFMLLGIGALFLLAVRISGLSLSPADSTYTIYAEFNDIGGLRERGKVSMAGVTIGQITEIKLDPKSVKARVAMELDADVDYISRDSVAVVSTAGLLGEKYLNIAIGGDPDTLAEGDYIENTQSALNLEKLIGNFATSNL